MRSRRKSGKKPEERGSRKAAAGLTHVDAAGSARMVDTAEKPVTLRFARAGAAVWMKPETLALIRRGAVAKGDVLAAARIAGIAAAKRTADLIPLCHPVALTSVEVAFDFEGPRSGWSAVRIEAAARALDRTGVEMEALVAASVAALTVYDMCKAADRGMRIGEVRLIEKRGGRSGTWIAGEESGRNR